MGGWWDISTFILCVHEHAPLKYSNLSWLLSAYLEDPGLLGVPRHPSPVPFWAPNKFSHKGWAELPFFFPLFFLFFKAQSLPIHGFWPLPTYLKWTLIGGFRLCPFFEGPKWVLNFNFAMFWVLKQCLWYFGPQQWFLCSHCWFPPWMSERFSHHLIFLM